MGERSSFFTRPGDGEARLLRQVVRLVEHLRRDVPLEDDALDRAGAVAELQEVELPGGAAAVEPAVERHLLPVVAGDVGDVDGREHVRVSSGGSGAGARWEDAQVIGERPADEGQTQDRPSGNIPALSCR